ncbi:hypothetical protein MG293_003744 [Ovis ammon polii]|uniref:Uncharacterized protein n=1 Tax=Ovis ammon polii TaxID=230172 RepID=A0AAD4UNP6_OVIAM|nr:hypothetical protein MG293_003744 [Ovis ammon polii]
MLTSLTCSLHILWEENRLEKQSSEACSFRSALTLGYMLRTLPVNGTVLESSPGGILEHCRAQKVEPHSQQGPLDLCHSLPKDSSSACKHLSLTSSTAPYTRLGINIKIDALILLSKDWSKEEKTGPSSNPMG